MNLKGLRVNELFLRAFHCAALNAVVIVLRTTCVCGGGRGLPLEGPKFDTELYQHHIGLTTARQVTHVRLGRGNFKDVIFVL